ncbi:hypothetical protein [Halonotius roseus]|uniref:Uncharacterized protein n=1 Tax=Halonotius roseus TaxID=2511997 RepID=A0A544QSE5_9EURY|nr:hypothetical protein [Halonotius roseus]TQQ82358.1 hypothetical protein EWF95_05390 [Halonotius roseus]
MSRPADETEGDIEHLLTSSESSSLRDQMRQFIEANGGEIDLKAERKIGTDDDMLSSVVIDNRDEHR